MAKNPFSLYDFLGYVFPGGILMFFVVLALALNSIDTECFFNSISDIECWKDVVFPKISFYFKWNNSLIILLMSYVLGHLMSFLSALLIETFAVWTYGYPTEFLLNKIKKWKYIDYKTITRYSNRSQCLQNIATINKYVFRLLLLIFLFPISICSLLLGQWLGFKYFVIKNINKFQKDMLLEKFGLFNRKILKSGIKSDEHEKTEIIKLLYHYYYENNIAHQKKIDNYVALYGLLRSITLIFNIFTIYLIYHCYSSHLLMCKPQLIVITMFILGTYLFYLSYLKFYRRYTEEILMCLLTDKDI